MPTLIPDPKNIPVAPTLATNPIFAKFDAALGKTTPTVMGGGAPVTSRADEIRALGGIKAPASESKGMGVIGDTIDASLHGTADAASQGVSEIGAGVQEAADAMGDPTADQMPHDFGHALLHEVTTGRDIMNGGLRAGFGGLGVLFSPITAAVQKISQTVSNSPGVQQFAQKIGPILDSINSGVTTYDEIAAKDPKTAETIKNLFNIFTLGGAKKAGDFTGEAASSLAGKAKEVLVGGPDDGGTGGLVGKVKATADTATAALKERNQQIAKPSGFLEQKAAQIGQGIKQNLKNNIEDTKNQMQERAAISAKGPNATRVYDETGSNEFINNLDRTTSPEDLAAKSKMLGVADARLKGTASDSLPRHVISDEYIKPRIDALQSRLGTLGKTIGAAKDDSTVVDTTDVFNHMVNEASKVGVHVGQDADGQLTFSKAPGVSGIDATRINSVKNMFDGFNPDEAGNTSNTISQLAQTRKNLSDLTSRADSAKEVSAPGGAVDSTRRFIAQKIGPAYHAATKDYSDISRVLEQLDPDLKVRLSDEGTKDITKIKLADYSRRLLSNNAAQAKSVFKSLNELAQKEYTRLGKTLPKQNLEDLVDTAGAIEEGLGITPRNSFFGQIKGAGEHVVSGIPTSIGGAISKTAEFLTKPKANPQRALRAMQDYLNEIVELKKQ